MQFCKCKTYYDGFTLSADSGEGTEFTVKQHDGKQKMWTPEYLSIHGNVKKMLIADIESEKAAINQYKVHIKMIKDNYINAVLARIIRDEEYHIMMLQALFRDLQ